jgi:HD-GYP domain-containing protein (c-di-GMP phosphodiesterase class II)
MARNLLTQPVEKHTVTGWEMKTSLWIFVGLCILGGAAVLGQVIYIFASTNSSSHQTDAASLMFLTFLGILSELKPVRYYFSSENRSEVTLGLAVFLPTLMLYGWPFAVLVAILASASTDLYDGKRWYKVAFNAANYALATWSAGQVFGLVMGKYPLSKALTLGMLGGTLSGFTFFIVNSLLLGVVLSISTRLHLFKIFSMNIRLMIPVFVAEVGLAVVAAVLWTLQPASVLLLIPPAIMTKLSYSNYVQLRIETDNFMLALAEAVDARDPYTGQHSQRVADLCRTIARRLHLPDREVNRLYAIARVHDVGKITVRDAVLLKPGPLSPEELKEMREHVEAGARILGHLSFYRDSLDVLLQHHERLDGSGYPKGLREDEILLPARILAVADAYDAMTTQRPYRPAKTPEEAVRELYRLAGKQYDLSVVRALEDELLERRMLEKPVLAATEPVPELLEAIDPDAPPAAARVIPLRRVDPGRKSS